MFDGGAGGGGTAHFRRLASQVRRHVRLKTKRGSRSTDSVMTDIALACRTPAS